MAPAENRTMNELLEAISAVEFWFGLAVGVAAPEAASRALQRLVWPARPTDPDGERE